MFHPVFRNVQSVTTGAESGSKDGGDGEDEQEQVKCGE